jgi:hypothetical protein
MGNPKRQSQERERAKCELPSGYGHERYEYNPLQIRFENAFCPATVFHENGTLSFVIPRASDFFDLFVFSAYPTSCISTPDKADILKAGDFFAFAQKRLLSLERAVVDGKVVLAAQQRSYPLATVLSLSTTLSFLSSRAYPDRQEIRGSRGICSAPFGCPKFTVLQPLSLSHPERSASQIYRVPPRLVARSRRTPAMLRSPE